MVKNKKNAAEGEVHLFGLRRKIDGLTYEGSIPAKSFEEAKEMAKKIGAEIDGRLTRK